MAQIFQPLPFRGNDSLIYQLDIQADYSYDDCERLPENQEIQNEEVASSSDGTGETTHPFGVYGAFSNMTHLYCKRVQCEIDYLDSTLQACIGQSPLHENVIAGMRNLLQDYPEAMSIIERLVAEKEKQDRLLISISASLEQAKQENEYLRKKLQTEKLENIRLRQELLSQQQHTGMVGISSECPFDVFF